MVISKADSLRKQLIKKTRRQMKEHYAVRDVHIIKAVNLLEDIDTVFNMLAEQLLEWYAVYFPELGQNLRDNEAILKLIYNLGARENYTFEGVMKYYSNESKAKKISEFSNKSIGADVEEQDIAEMKLLALNLLNLKEERQYLAKYLEKTMKKSYPNFTKLSGPILGAKLIAKANSFKKLALSPSSTIQLLGAEKALFSALKTGAKGPKYGLLYQHPLVKEVRAFNKGKVARSLAAKLAIAAREDYFGNKEIDPNLEKSLRERVDSISSKKPKHKHHKKFHKKRK